MKKIGLLSVLLFLGWPSFAQNDEIKWLSLEQALTLNKTHPKKILVDVYTTWCYYCKVMDKNTYSNPKVIAYINTNFYPVKFNGEQRENLNFDGKDYKYIPSGQRGYHEFAAALLNGKLSYPTTVFFDDKTQVITRLPGYLDAKNYEPVLVFIAENYYTTKSWDDFVKNYKGTF